MSLDWRVVPIQRWPTEPTRTRQKHPFRVGHSPGVAWGSTVDLLEREFRELRAKKILLQMAVTDEDIRNDGWIRSNARPSMPGVILTFESKHGPLSYPCDQFTDWQANVRAIALALEALRKVDRYGVTRRGEQYTGWKQLPPAGGMATMTLEVAARLVAVLGRIGSAMDVITDADTYRAAYRSAARATHPDSGGSVEAFQNLQAARAILDRHHGIKS